ncbi:GNAT family N-acetyltransferase [Chondromyces crocatus]|uniref:Acetyltransferase n=1 Tax=Chondromyces crocatus TaxID=52 RepID=A0A0K1EE61_CHOCO|nr:GNAT family N-acetyltransferase [Chondromyces crocatus]AKT38982.1 acetyltransferase [Chondromyces crocatus]
MIERSEAALFERIEAFYDAVPRDRAQVESFGPLTLFVADPEGLPLYARPALHAFGAPTVDDIRTVRERQRELDVPEAFEWVQESTPSLGAMIEAEGLTILHAPLMVLEPARLRAFAPSVSTPVRLLDPDRETFAEDLSSFRAIAQVSFAASGMAVGLSGPAERDEVRAPALDVEVTGERVRAKQAAYALAGEGPDGALAGGAFQRAGDVVEIVGVATLPSARRGGLGAAVTAALAREALVSGAALVILSAGSDDVARVYARLGFRRVGTACIAAPVDADVPG